jgi:hypothetical protein
VGRFKRGGDLDFVTANFGYQSPWTVSVLLGNGNGTFQPQQTYVAEANPNAISLGDFNRDGNVDLAVADFGSESISILLGNGDGTFGEPHNFAVGYLPNNAAVGDFNGDGKLDLAVADAGTNIVSVLINDTRDCRPR